MAYFDHAATTPCKQSSIQAMQAVMTSFYGNPSSLHDAGIEVRKKLNHTRRAFAELLHAQREEIIFTSSGTEGNNAVIKGVYFKLPDRQIITSTIEHHASLNALEFVKKQGGKTAFVQVDHKGFIDCNYLKRLLKTPTSLVSIVYANNELGTVQPLEEIKKIVKEAGAYLHLDMVQSPLNMLIDFSQLDVDFITLSAHKVGGPFGVGCLVARRGIAIEPLIHGGKQEMNTRAGTENLPGIVGFYVALKEAQENYNVFHNKVAALSRYFIDALNREKIPYVLNGPALDEPRIHSIVNIGLLDQDAQTASFILNEAGIYVSLGSACDSVRVGPSHVITAINVAKKYREGCLRFSFSVTNTVEEIDQAVAVLKTLSK